MKAFTDLEQSKQLAKILPLESADVYYWHGYNRLLRVNDGKCDKYDIPAWSLATLIGVLPPDLWGYNDHYFLEISKMGDASAPNEVRYYRHRKEIDGADYDRISHISHTSENLIDACVNMIITLNDHKLLFKEH